MNNHIGLQTDDRCECGGEFQDWCSKCGEPTCEADLDISGLCHICIGNREREELQRLWWAMDERCTDHPAGIVHMAWAHSYRDRSMDDAGYVAAVGIFKRAIGDIWTGWRAA